ncbi:MAG: FkbM family methyltransferase, partial [Actinomycetota bacterium]
MRDGDPPPDALRELVFAIRRCIAFLTVPYFRLELPGWERLSSLVGLPISNRALWARAAPRTVRGKLHGFRMRLRMQDWSERLTYFLGRYYELPLERLLQSLLERGETFIDVGGNIGMITLTAASRVGEEGTIHTFEPNPEMVGRIRETVALNRLTNVSIYPIGLSDAEADLVLTTVSESGGWGTFAPVTERVPSLTYGAVMARVARADEALVGKTEGPLVVKIDVEGFECRVLRGMSRLIDRLRPAIITEVESQLLQSAASSVNELFEMMRAWG